MIVAEVRRAVERPSVSEIRQRLAGRTPVTTTVPPAEAVRAERDAR